MIIQPSTGLPTVAYFSSSLAGFSGPSQTKISTSISIDLQGNRPHRPRSLTHYALEKATHSPLLVPGLRYPGALKRRPIHQGPDSKPAPIPDSVEVDYLFDLLQ